MRIKVLFTSNNNQPLFQIVLFSYFLLSHLILFFFEAILMLGSRTKNCLHVPLSVTPLAPSILLSSFCKKLFPLRKIFTNKQIQADMYIEMVCVWTHVHTWICTKHSKIYTDILILNLAHILSISKIKSKTSECLQSERSSVRFFGTILLKMDKCSSYSWKSRNKGETSFESFLYDSRLK